MSSHIYIAAEVRAALDAGLPVVALESAVFTHGLPEPYNLDSVRAMDLAIRAGGATPATCLIESGRLWVGADLDLASRVARDPKREKASVRDLGAVIAAGAPAGLTVSATIFAAQSAGIRVFATGGIGGVHRDAAETGDVSADLLQLARCSVVTVCSGAKSVLDIPRTLELLETLGVPVYSYGSPHFPAFYVRESGRTSPALFTPEAVARAAQAQWELGYSAGMVVGNPIPESAAISEAEWTEWLVEAEKSALSDGIRGKAVTPYLLARVAELSGGRTVQSNLALLESNASLAALISAALTA